jgi:hypothetical protein
VPLQGTFSKTENANAKGQDLPRGRRARRSFLLVSCDQKRDRKVEGLWRLLLLLLVGFALERSFDLVNKRAQDAEKRTETEAPALDTDCVDEEVH